MQETVADFTRLALTVVWGLAAWNLCKAWRIDRQPIRLFGGLVAMLWSLYNFWLNWAIHSGWDTIGWHSNINRTLSGLTAMVFIVWALGSLERVGKWKSG